MIEPPWDFILYMAAMVVPMIAMIIWAWPVFKRQAKEMEEYDKLIRESKEKGERNE